MKTDLRKLKNRIMANSFALTVRTRMVFDQTEYDDLCKALVELADAIKGSAVIDRELMQCLYSTPMIIRNAFESFSDQKIRIAQQLEDAWVELDELVENCLVG